MPPRTRGAEQPRKLGGDLFLVVDEHQLAAQRLPFPARSLPVVQDDPDNINPCSIAPCTTADHTRGSACCRDLQVEIMCQRSDTALEAMVRSRLSPYLCKVSRESDEALEAEMISACGFLDEEGANCTLHGRKRPDGRAAKPELCSEWPDDGKGLHPGCILLHPAGEATEKEAVTQQHGGITVRQRPCAVRRKVNCHYEVGALVAVGVDPHLGRI